MQGDSIIDFFLRLLGALIESHSEFSSLVGYLPKRTSFAGMADLRCFNQFVIMSLGGKIEDQTRVEILIICGLHG